jgi:hypothetical protein
MHPLGALKHATASLGAGLQHLHVDGRLLTGRTCQSVLQSLRRSLAAAPPPPLLPLPLHRRHFYASSSSSSRCHGSGEAAVSGSPSQQHQQNQQQHAAAAALDDGAAAEPPPPCSTTAAVGQVGLRAGLAGRWRMHCVKAVAYSFSVGLFFPSQSSTPPMPSIQSTAGDGGAGQLCADQSGLLRGRPARGGAPPPPPAVRGARAAEEDEARGAGGRQGAPGGHRLDRRQRCAPSRALPAPPGCCLLAFLAPCELCCYVPACLAAL